MDAKTIMQEDAKTIMQENETYYSKVGFRPSDEYHKAQKLCWEYNQTDPSDYLMQNEILSELFGTYSENIRIMPNFHCDFGFTIHLGKSVFINYNCVILDTSPVIIKDNVLIGPNVTLACAGHAIDAAQRTEGIQTSSPICIEKNVWIGAGATVCGGVTIGEGSVIGAGSVVTNDIPSGVIAVGNPCRVLRKITENDKIHEGLIEIGE